MTGIWAMPHGTGLRMQGVFMAEQDKKNQDRLKGQVKKSAVKLDASFKEDGIGITIEALFKGLEGLASSKTVVGEPIYIDDVKLIPLIEVTAGLASGELGKNAKKNGAGAMSAKVTPVAILLLQHDHVRLISVKDQDIFTRLLDMIPDAIDRLTGGLMSKHYDKDAKDVLDDMGVEVIMPEDGE